MTRHLLGAVALGLLAGAAAQAAPLKNPMTGTPKLIAIDTIRFGPEGLLLIGDGPGSQLVAVETGDTTLKPWTAKPIEKLDEQLAGRLGAMAKNLVIHRLAINPASGTAYLVVRRPDLRKSLLMTIDGTGKIGEFTLENVKYVSVPLPKGEKAQPNRITDLAWADDRVLVGAAANEEFACKVFSVPTPLDAAAAGTLFSTETYHVAHRAWETKAPMSVLMPFEDKGKKYVVGAFACTPVVKYPLEDLKPNARVKGQSVVELGSGNQPLRMFAYEKGGKSYVLMNTFRFHHERAPFGPSPNWTVRMELDLLGENEKINEKALQRLDKGKPATERIQMIEAYHGVVLMDKLDKERALTLRNDATTGLTLAALLLP